jgi:hypothetical protein
VEAACALEKSLQGEQGIRQAALSIGLPILLADGEHLLFAHRGVMDKEWEEKPWEITPEMINKWASREWIDLRQENVERWQRRSQSILHERESAISDSSSRLDRGETFWQRDQAGKTIIDPGEFAAWVVIRELGGGRSEAYRET